MATPKVTKPRNVTYLGVPAMVWETRTGGAYGERVHAVLWLDKAVGQKTEHEEGTVVLNHISGNGRLGTLVTHGVEILKPVDNISTQERIDRANTVASLMLTAPRVTRQTV